MPAYKRSGVFYFEIKKAANSEESRPARRVGILELGDDGDEKGDEDGGENARKKPLIGLLVVLGKFFKHSLPPFYGLEIIFQGLDCVVDVGDDDTHFFQDCFAMFRFDGIGPDANQLRKQS